MNKKISLKIFFILLIYLFPAMGNILVAMDVQSMGQLNGSSVSGIIQRDTVWTKSQSPYRLTGDVQINTGVKLTIEPGVEVIGDNYRLVNYGGLKVVGTTVEPIQLKNVQLIGKNINYIPYQLEIQHVKMEGGKLLPPTGNASYSETTIKNSHFKNLEDYTHIWYPKNEVEISQNIFENTGHLSIGSEHNSYITNNVFYNIHNPYREGVIDVWANYNNSKTYIYNNSFYNRGMVLTMNVDSEIVATNNYWHTLDEDIVAQRLNDPNIDYLPILKSPHKDTPYFEVDDPMQVGETIRFENRIVSSDLQIHYVEADKVRNNIQFTIGYESRRNRKFSFFEPPSAMIHTGELPKGTEKQIQFTVKSEALKGKEYITMKFYDPMLEDERNFIYLNIEDIQKVLAIPDEILNVDLKQLSVSEGQLTPRFEPHLTEYTVSVPSHVSRLLVEGEAADEFNQVIGLGTHTLKFGLNTLKVKVLAEDNTSKTYTVKVTRELSNNANLKSISLSTGELSPSFEPEIVDYTVEVPYEVDTIRIEGNVEDPLASVNGPLQPSLRVGDNNVTLQVIAQDGTQKGYTINIIRAKSSNAYLQDIVLSQGTLQPTFDPETMMYEVEVEYETTAITIAGILQDPTASINGPIRQELEVGDNRARLEVIAQDGSQKNYHINVKRAKCNNANLKTITVSEGQLSPDFSPDITAYKVDVGYSVKSITVGGQVQDPTATVIGPISKGLAVGENRIELVVTAQDGTTNTYTITVTRAPSNNNYLNKITLSHGQLTPAFNPNNQYYEVVVDNEVEVITISGTPADKNASTNGPIRQKLEVGKTTIDLNVTAQDGSIRVYTLEVTRKPSSNANLKDIQVSYGTLSPAFDPNVTQYTVKVAHEVESITIEGKVQHEQAKVDGPITETLEVGENYITLVVRAEDGAAKAYIIEVIRAYPLGDINQDDQIDEVDLEILAQDYNKTDKDLEWKSELDLNQDGIIDLFDLILISNQIK